MRAKVEHVVADAGQFGKQHAQVLGADRHRHIQQLFHRQHVAVLHAERGAIVQPVEIGQRLQIGLVLDQLFGAAVEQAHMRVDPLDDFAIKLHDHAQNPMRRRVLRAEVDGVVGDDFIASGRRLLKLHAHFAAPPAASWAFSSPGSTYWAPSHGLMKSNCRRSCASFTGS